MAVRQIEFRVISPEQWLHQKDLFGRSSTYFALLVAFQTFLLGCFQLLSIYRHLGPLTSEAEPIPLASGIVRTLGE